MTNKFWKICILTVLATVLVCVCAFAAADGVTLGLTDYNEDFVQENQDGSATVLLNQWVHFAAYAPGAGSVSFHALDAPLDENNTLNDENEFGWDFTDPHDPEGRVDCQWIETGFTESVNRYIYAQAYYGTEQNGYTAVSECFVLHVVRDATISGSITYTVPTDKNTVYSTSTDGTVWEVPRDGRLFVDVNNMAGVDYFGLCIKGANENDPWVADSHWVELTDNNPQHTTRVPLTVPRCTVNTDYQVTVFAIKFGAPQKDAQTTIPIHVTEASSDCPVILSMGNTFMTGEPLRVYAHYTNPDGIQDGALQIRIYETGNPDNTVYDEVQGFEDFWNDWDGIWQSGWYTVDANILQYGETVRSYPGIKQIEVKATGRTVAPVANTFLTFDAGQDLVMNLSVPTGTTVMPEWYDYALFRIDWNHEMIDADSSDKVDANGAATITIPADRFEAGGQYELRLFSMKPGYDVGVTQFRFVVTTPGAVKKLTLTVNGSTAGVQEVLSSTNVRVKVDYDGERPTVIRIVNGDHIETWWGEEDNFERNWGFGDDELIMYAEASWDAIDDYDLDDPDFDWNRDIDWTGKSNIIQLNVTSPNGVMKIPEFTISNPQMAPGGSGVIPWGNDLVINIADEGPYVLDENAQGGKRIVEDGWFYMNIDVERTNEYGDTWWDRITDGWSYNLHSGENRIPTYNMEDGCRYSIEVGADGEGYSGRSDWCEFQLGEKTGEEELNPFFTVNGRSDTFSIETHTEMQLLAYHPNGEWYNVVITEKDNEEWRDEKNDCRSGLLMDSWRSDHEGEFTLTAYAYGKLAEPDKDGNDTWEEEIGSITINVTAEDDLDEVTAEMNDKAYVGDQLEISFSQVPNAEEYSYWIHSDGDNRWIMGDSRYSAGSLTINTSELRPGVYWVELDAMAKGYNQSHNTIHFALLDRNDYDASDPDGDYYFTVSPVSRSVPTETEIRCIAYMPGADGIELRYQKDNEEEIQELQYRDGPGITSWFSRGDSGTYKIYISGRFDGNWSAPEEAATVTVTAENEFDHEPTVTVNGSASGETAPADENNPGKMTIQVMRDANAEGYHVQLREYNDGRHIFNWYTDLNNDENDEWTTITNNSIRYEIEDGRIEPGRMYELNVWAHARDYECKGIGRVFLLQEEGTLQNISLVIQPTCEDGKFWTAEDVQINVTAPEGVTAIKLCMNNETHFFNNGEREIHLNIWDPETVFYAYATTSEIPEGDFDWNELNWNMWSGLVRIHAETMGNIPNESMPVLTFNNQVTKGDWFVFTIGEGEVRQTDIRIRDQYGNEREFRRYWEPGTYRIPTANLEPGQYEVAMNCVQNKYMWTNGPQMELYVSAPQTDTGFFRADKNELYPLEKFIPTVYWPGAAHIWIGDEHWNQDPNNHEGIWGDWDGDNGTNHADWEWWFDDPGTYTLRAWALTEGSNTVTEIGSVQFTVLEQTPLGQADIQVDSVVDATQPVYINIPPVQYGYYYSLQIHAQGQDESEWVRWHQTADDINLDVGSLVFTIPANTLQPDTSYWIDCYIDPADRDYAHNGSDSSRSILATNGNARNNQISVEVDNGEYVTKNNEGIFVPINAPFSVTVSASTTGAQPTAVALYMGDQVRYDFFNEHDGSATTENFGLSEYQPWAETIYARAYYDSLDEYDGWEAVPWSTLEWSAPSEAVEVQFTSNGKAGQPGIDIEWATMEGQDMIIHVVLGNYANEAHANLDRITDDGWQEDLVFNEWIGWEEDPDHPGTGIIRIPTDGLGTNCFRVHVDNSGIGYDNKRTTAWKWIAENPYQNGSKLTLPKSLTEIEDEAFEGIAADTVIIPYGVTKIGNRAFANSNVRLVVIPSSVDTIGDGAFSNSNLLIVYTDQWTEAVQGCVADNDAAAFCIIRNNE